MRHNRPLMIGVLSIGKIDSAFLFSLSERLDEVFEGCRTIVREGLDLQSDSYDHTRGQYHSTKMLQSLSRLMNSELDRVLGVTQVDLYIPSFNFVFGEGECPGHVAVISIFRLMPKFCDEDDGILLLQRAVKEAVHELGHTFGLVHCVDSRCVMFFSKSVTDTDQKHDVFCDKCFQLVRKAVQIRRERLQTQRKMFLRSWLIEKLRG